MEANKKGLYALFAIFGVLCVVLGALGVYALSSKTSTQTPSSAQETQPVVNTTLDNVVAGSGALSHGRHEKFTDVGVSFPATCIGAIQAGAEWSQKVFLNTTRLEPISHETLDSFFDEITLTPGLIKSWGGSSRGVIQVARLQYESQKGEVTHAYKRVYTSPHVQDGLAQLINCSITANGSSSAVVRIYTVFANEVPDTQTRYLPGDYFGDLTFELREQNGVWRLSRLTAPKDPVTYQLREVGLRACEKFINTDEKVRDLGAWPLGDAGRKIISDCAGGSGFHSFANAGGEWGKP